MNSTLQKRKKKKRHHQNTYETTSNNTQDQIITPSHFSFAITRIAVSQVCRSVGFSGVKQSALETLTLIASKYLQTIAKSAVSYANTSNRTQSNLFDLINGLHDIYYSVQGLSDASVLHKRNYSLLKSTALIDLRNFVELTDEIPFAKPIPPCSDFLGRNSIAGSSALGLNLRGSHIPNWLTDFPDASTYEKKGKGGRFERRRENGEELWENSNSVQLGICNGNGDGENWERTDNGGIRLTKVEEEKKNELSQERERVRFKIGRDDEGRGGRFKGRACLVGVNLRNGTCRGGKRVCWKSNYNDSDANVNSNLNRVGEEEDGETNGFSAKKRR